jgi:4-amino-4-deoxy-L-arabinose transferase-like glycosyltransferase
VTPHYDFIPRLDKPILFFDVVALSFKVFGVSEWAARLPAVVAALGCILLTYFVSRTFFGEWAALWSGLILITSLEFFGLARVVMMETLLTLFVTLALCCFYIAHAQAHAPVLRFPMVVMYGAMGIATAIKGPIGFVLPAAIIFCYLLLARRWDLLRHMQFTLGILVFSLAAFPWYGLAEWRNPGYLQYFFWEENVLRFTTNHFNRNHPWYYFIAVLAAGFFPWSLLLPSTLRFWVARANPAERLFLGLWILVPFIFFSLSSAKQAHYILPLFPPLSIMVGAMLGNVLRSPSRRTTPLFLPLIGFFLLASAAIVIGVWPQLLSGHLASYVQMELPPFAFVGFAGFVLVIATALTMFRIQRQQQPVFLATAVGFAVVVFLVQATMAAVAAHRSSKALALQTAPMIHPGDQLALFGGYPSSLPFYLRVDRPIAIILSEQKRTILGSDYVALKRPEPVPGYGKVLYSLPEFASLWETSRERIVVFADRNVMDRFGDLGGAPARTLARVRDKLLVARAAGDNSVIGATP